MKTIGIIAGVAVALVGGVGFVFFGDRLGPSPDQRKIEAVRENLTKWALKDPSSAQFSDEEAGATVVCGRVNAKNSFGGYTGAKAYTASLYGGGDSWYVEKVVFLEDDPAAYLKASHGCPSRASLQVPPSAEGKNL